MAFSLSKAEMKRRDEIIGTLNSTGSALEDEVNDFNEKLAALLEPLQKAIDEYNEAVQEARSFAEDIASEADSAISDKSEKWQDGEKGQQAIQWKDAWEGASWVDAEIELPTPIEFSCGGEENENGDTLNMLPEDADQA